MKCAVLPEQIGLIAFARRLAAAPQQRQLAQAEQAERRWLGNDLVSQDPKTLTGVVERAAKSEAKEFSDKVRIDDAVIEHIGWILPKPVADLERVLGLRNRAKIS